MILLWLTFAFLLAPCQPAVNFIYKDKAREKPVMASLDLEQASGQCLEATLMNSWQSV